MTGDVPIPTPQTPEARADYYFPEDANRYAVSCSAYNAPHMGIGWFTEPVGGRIYLLRRPCLIMSIFPTHALARPGIFADDWSLHPRAGAALLSFSLAPADQPRLVWGLVPPADLTTFGARANLLDRLPMGEDELPLDGKKLARFVRSASLPRDVMESFWLHRWLLAREGA